MKKNIKWIICLITGLIIKFSTYTISKILRKVIILRTLVYEVTLMWLKSAAILINSEK